MGKVFVFMNDDARALVKQQIEKVIDLIPDGAEVEVIANLGEDKIANDKYRPNETMTVTMTVNGGCRDRDISNITIPTSMRGR